MDNRIFKEGDMVVYKPHENSDKRNTSNPGIIKEAMDDDYYIVTFGLNSIYGIRTGKYHWTKLFEAK